jgi:hypothetical protein
LTPRIGLTPMGISSFGTAHCLDDVDILLKEYSLVECFSQDSTI